MLRWRLILGVLFVAGLVGLFYLDILMAGEAKLPPGLVLLPLLLTIVGAATREYVDLVRTREPDVDHFMLSVGNWVIVASPWFGTCVGGREAEGRWQIFSFALMVIIAFFREMRRYDKDDSRRVTERIALTVLGLVYLGLMPSFFVRMRLLPLSIWPVVLTLVVVKMSDIGAYFMGRAFGRHKLAPKLSPGKTWEGAGGGLLFAVAAAVGFCMVNPGGTAGISNDVPLGPYVWFAILVFMTGVVGDLAESLLKRDFGRKDSSTWMPGFGGVLDLVDSPIFVAPVAWAFWEFGWLPS